ncbi:MAG: F0F1 ATP synthase subunit B [Ignavibacteriales bacterium]|nr:F0F1 ATP synthase subunit B [Ignavibacteriales bacterium]
MFANLNLALIALLSEGEKKGGLLDVNPGLIIWTVITFVLLLLILKKFAWKPILGALDEREKYIKDSLEKSERARDEAEKLLLENKANLARAEENAQKVLAQARDMAEKLINQKTAETEVKVKKMMEDAGAEIKRKTDESFETLKNQVALIAIEAAEKILNENLDKEKQAKIVNKFINELPKN